MRQAIGALLPIAVAAAVSSVPIMATILILLSERRKESALPFLVGWVLGTIVLVGGTTLAASSVPHPRSRGTETTLAWVEILLGAALVVLSVRSIRHRHERVGVRASGWTQQVGSWGPVKTLGLGLGLNIRPKGILLSTAASLVLQGAHLKDEENVVAVLVYAAIATSTVTVPIVATILAPHRMEPRLLEARDWLEENGSTITAMIMLMIGVVIVGGGIGNL